MNMEAIKEKEVNIFRNGRSRAVRIPAEFEIEGDSVLMSQDENGVIHIRPKQKKMTLVEVLDWLAEQEPFDERMPEIEDPPPEPFDLGHKR
ncbi:antitoxin [Pararhizobium sp. LjRoot238]|uniref:antitoxin n=1 Tax=Pararhizobium sp. LjRoot238 TaxID=3342293 RepID=UPI003ECE83B1